MWVEIYNRKNLSNLRWTEEVCMYIDLQPDFLRSDDKQIQYIINRFIEINRLDIIEAMDLWLDIVLIEFSWCRPIIPEITRLTRLYPNASIINKNNTWLFRWISTFTDEDVFILNKLWPIRHSISKIRWVSTTVCVLEVLLDLYKLWFNTRVLLAKTINAMTCGDYHSFHSYNNFNFIENRYGDFKRFLNYDWIAKNDDNILSQYLKAA